MTRFFAFLCSEARPTMKNHFAARAAAWLMAGALLVEGFVTPAAVGAQTTGQTAPGTNITNNATATYQDASGNTYNTTSNTVTTIVQNAPTIAETVAAGTSYAPGQVVTDSFTITNQGNAGGFFQVSGTGYAVSATTGAFTTVTDATIGGTDSAFGTLGGGPTASSGCGTGVSKYAVSIGGGSATYCDTLADLNTYLATQTIPAYSNTTADTIVVTTYYTIAGNATTTGSPTITSTFNANIQYAAVSGAAQEVSAVSTATSANTIVADANINQYKASTQVTTTPAPAGENLGDLTYTISATNGGAKDAKDLVSVKTLLGSAWSSINGGTNAGGVLLSDKIPTFNSAPLSLSNISGGNYQVKVTPNTAYGFPATNAKAYVVYSTSSTAATWAVAGGGPATPSAGSTTTFTIPTSAGTIYYIGVVIVNGTCTASGYELCSYTANTTSNGNANTASYPAVKYSYTVAQPTGPNSANPGSVQNVGDAAWGDNQPTEHVLGPGVTANTSDSTCAGTCLNQTNVGINYTGSVTPGASNKASDQALAAFGALTGPYDSTETGTCVVSVTLTNCQGADATGSYDGNVATSFASDFTAKPFGASADNVINTSTTPGSPTTVTTTTSGSTMCIAHTLFNSGNKNDSYNIAIAAQPTAYAVPATSGGTASSGWTFGIYSDSGCSTALGGASQGATTTASNVADTSGAPLQYYVKYVVPSGLKYFTRFDSTITVTSVGDGTQSNTTHDELYSSFIALTKTENVASTGCPVGALPALPGTSATQVCPGGTISYTVDYRNLVQGTASTNVSFAACFTKVSKLTVSEDGTKGTTSSTTLPNWATFTTGLQSALTSADKDSAGNARSGTNASAFTYYTAIPAASPSGTFTAGATAFDDQVGGTTFQLVPHGYFTSGISGNPTSVTEPAAADYQGTISFTLTVK